MTTKCRAEIDAMPLTEDETETERRHARSEIDLWRAAGRAHGPPLLESRQSVWRWLATVDDLRTRLAESEGAKERLAALAVTQGNAVLAALEHLDPDDPCEHAYTHLAQLFVDDGADDGPADVSLRAETVVEKLRAEARAPLEAENTRLRELLAVINRDGGHRAEEVGIDAAAGEAEAAWHALAKRVEELEAGVRAHATTVLGRDALGANMRDHPDSDVIADRRLWALVGHEATVPAPADWTEQPDGMPVDEPPRLMVGQRPGAEKRAGMVLHVSVDGKAACGVGDLVDVRPADPGGDSGWVCERRECDRMYSQYGDAGTPVDEVGE